MINTTRDSLESFIERAPAALGVLDHNLVYVTTSGRWREVHRLREPDPVGRSAADIGPGSAEWWCELQRRVRAQPTPVEDERPFAGADGQARRWHIVASPWMDGDGHTGMIVVTEDVTARVEAERADAFKTRFLSAASHDLRQPLQSLGMYLAVLARRLQLPAERAICEKMQQSREAVAHILEALLDVAKLESGALKPEKREFELGAWLARVVASSEPHADAKGLTLTCRTTACNVYSDPALLERIVENLVANAIRYTERGEVSVSCDVGDSAARIVVEDSGSGIPAGVVGRIFDEYYQVVPEGAARRSGFGLGLSIVKLISRLLEHEVAVASVPGQGSTFTVTVPLGRTVVETTSSCEDRRGAVAVGQSPVVLLIDDDAAVVDATTLLLQSAGLTIHSAASGAAACERLTAGLRPDVVICDYRMPGADGASVIRSVRGIARTEVPAILLTGDISARDIDRAHVAACAVLHKPVDADRLLEEIAVSLKTARG